MLVVLRGKEVVYKIKHPKMNENEQTTICFQWLTFPRKLHTRFHPPGGQAPLQHIMILSDFVSCYLFPYASRPQPKDQTKQQQPKTLHFSTTGFLISVFAYAAPALWNILLSPCQGSLSSSFPSEVPLEYIHISQQHLLC